MTASLWAFLPPEPDGEISACVVTSAGDILARGSLGDCAGMEFQRCVAVVAGMDIALARLDVPQGTPVQMRAAGRLMMEDIVAIKEGAFDAAVAVRGGVDGLRWVAHFPAQLCTQVLERLAAFQLDPDAIVPAATLLPAPEAGCVTSTYMGIAIARSQARGFAAEADLLPLIIEGQGPLEEMPMDALEQAVVTASQQGLDLNLRVGVFEKASADRLQPTWFRRAAILTACAAVLWPLVPVIEAAKYERAISALDAQTLERVQAALPNARRIVNARAQLDERLQALGLSGGPGQLLGVFTRTLSQNAAAVTDSISVSPRGGLTATLIIADQTRLEQIAQQLRSSALDVEVGAIRVTADGPRAQLIIRGQR
jgi:general secretion pathway protein L